MVKSNPFGLVHMLGNVKEFCLDWYDSDIYATYPDHIKNPEGPPEGTEHVIRGGSYNSDAADVRISKRDHTRHDAWMVTDPQIPKSLWWYSDNNEVGFRVVCEYSE
jgi:formylglycine-generating enzyme required for sulfatase activity